LLANGRPSASTVQHAMKLQHTFPNKVVKLGHLGCYNLASLKVFEKMCALESDASNLRQVICWLSQTPEAQNTAGIIDALINSMLRDVILQQGQSIMDLSDFCTLACERDVNSFAIDTTRLTFLKEEKQSNVVYLNMPQQTTTGVGAGSCGIGVILSVRDITRSGKCLPPFQWDMGFL